MRDALQGFLVRMLRVPPKPEPPSGSPGSLRVFHAAKGFLVYKRLQWLLRQGSLVIGFVVAAQTSERIFGAEQWFSGDFFERISQSPDVPAAVSFTFGRLHELMAFLFLQGGLDTLLIALFLLQVPVSFALVGLAYRFRWYMITDRSLRIREGIWHVREQTMTFSNIQNVAIRQGPLQRFLGIADLEVRSAGGGSKNPDPGQREGDAANLHLARLAGVDNAQEIRDAIRAHLDRPPALQPPPARSSALDSARELLEEARGLRAALGG